jgi:nitrite reductase/ring-hydroxylating ferredoxin subunit
MAMLEDRSASVLRDGSEIGELVDRDRREVSLKAISDPDVYRVELERLFARSWILVGHESEIPNAGDFVSRSIGQDPVVVTRSDEGGISILLNACAHRAMQVCRADEGNCSTFKCPYHGWVYDLEGRLLGSPFEQEVYGDRERFRYRLRRARCETRHGLVFGCFADDTPPLVEWLGDFDWYLEEMFGQTEMEVLGPPQRAHIPANWKGPATQIAGDGLHTFTLHHSQVELGFPGFEEGHNDAATWGLEGVDVSTPQGHALRCVELPQYEVDGDQRGRLPGGWFLGGVIFPNAPVWSMPFRLPGMTHDLTTASIGGVRPRGPVSYEEWRLQLFDKHATEELKDLQRTVGKIFDTTVLADDVETFRALTEISEGVLGQQETLKFDALVGEHRPHGWPGPGDVHGGICKDDNQWQWWLRWRELMTSR